MVFFFFFFRGKRRSTMGGSLPAEQGFVDLSRNLWERIVGGTHRYQYGLGVRSKKVGP
ncbi:hypothetical protein CORC01_13320 [Colletotrichum orchidophilum]|uniref:Uncharacterized protein n=1 Tax=Colletotrichum orchidophilum TaxID=1209926 RepID=A0A1G4AQV5_9PEZI|nr:uncharacterized protein CORC01_13320 [Colletotrichum orchidophilum]OHE91402.1 hypothetical protein CORC01_13320 [Colletotrichum orchidophilum]